jgi:methylase of polypeptide subunit release factors
MIFQDILRTKQTAVLDDLLARCLQANNQLDLHQLHQLCKLAAGNTAINPLESLLERWINSLQSTPDYLVYAHDHYIAELWACWKQYSRSHLLNIQKPNSLITESIINHLQASKTIVDLGFGFGYTTAALKQIFPRATVWGTNLADTLQIEVAQTMAKDYQFNITDQIQSIEAPVDLVFASEYFEHIQNPIDHLHQVIEILRPQYWLIANAFGTTAIGHFDYYSVAGSLVPAKQCSKLFNAAMRQHGYKSIKTKLWNNRPFFWSKS